MWGAGHDEVRCGHSPLVIPFFIDPVNVDVQLGKMRNNLVLAHVGLGAMAMLSCSGGTRIASVLDQPTQFVDGEIEIRGIAANPRSDSLGAGGFYMLQQATGAGLGINEIRVRSNFLPAAGEEYDVRGHLVLDPQNANDPFLLEVARNAGADWLLIVIMGGVLGVGAIFVMFTATLFGLRLSTRKTETSTSIDSVQSNLEGPLSDYRARWRPMQPSENGAANAPEHVRRVAPEGPAVVVASRQKTVPFNYLGAELEVIEGPDRGRKFPVAASPLLIGRAGHRNNHVILTDNTVSMAHATIVRDTGDSSFSLVNDSQTNQACIDNAPVEKGALKDGSSIRLGATVLVFHQRSSNGKSKRAPRKRVKRVKQT